MVTSRSHRLAGKIMRGLQQMHAGAACQQSDQLLFARTVASEPASSGHIDMHEGDLAKSARHAQAASNIASRHDAKAIIDTESRPVLDARGDGRKAPSAADNVGQNGARRRTRAANAGSDMRADAGANSSRRSWGRNQHPGITSNQMQPPPPIGSASQSAARAESVALAQRSPPRSLTPDRHLIPRKLSSAHALGTIPRSLCLPMRLIFNRWPRPRTPSKTIQQHQR
jgi:hypothetical protein